MHKSTIADDFLRVACTNLAFSRCCIVDYSLLKLFSCTAK